MRIKPGLIIFALLLGAAPVAAQQPCGDGIPCKPVVWPLPGFPELTSPTPLPNSGGGDNLPTSIPLPTATWTPYPTSSPFATWTPFLDTAPISEKVETIQALIEGTDIPILNASGTPVTIQTQVAGIGSNANTFIGYMRTIQNSDIVGPFAPLVTMLFSGILILLLLKASDYIVPIVIALWGIIRKVVSVVLDFIPF
jgi:hypothetical protein